MVGKPFSSGCLLTDRRAEFAVTMAQAGDLAGAVEVLAGALEISPTWAAGWFQLGDYYEQADDPDNATAAWRQAMALDPADPFGAGLKLDLLRRVPVAERMPAAFVEMLFDQYAPHFEASLVDALDYRGPELLLTVLQGNGFSHAQRALDLGCGTGLMGAQLRPCCDWLEGVDISQGMLDQAQAKGIYDRLEKQDFGALGATVDGYDLIVAADVFIYLGALEEILGWCARALVPRGRLAFTLEHSEQPIELLESRRFAHSPAYVMGLLAEAGFQDLVLQDCVLRQDRGRDIRAFCVAGTLNPVLSERDEDGEAQVLA
jgi:predicted TPR repeat methyltransferase